METWRNINRRTRWTVVVVTLVWFAAVQAMEGLFISPKIIGVRVGLHPLTIIVAVMVGTTLLGGVIGGVLAIPLTAALRTLMFRYVWKDRVPSGNAITSTRETILDSESQASPPTWRGCIFISCPT